MTQPKVNQPNWVQYLTLAVMVFFLAGSMTYMRPTDPIAPQEIDENALITRITNGVVSGVVIPTATGNLTVDNSKIDEIYAEMFKDDAKEVIAENLVLDEIDSKDFLKAILGVLNDEDYENGSIEDYKDIEVYYSDVEKTNVTKDSATVEVTVKVRYFNDGDDEDDEKAKLTAIFEVEDLDEDEDYEDAEAFLEDLSIVKIYD
jgi:hypothetical protein